MTRISDPDSRLGDMVRNASDRLAAVGIAEPRLEGRVLVAHALDTDPAALLFDSERRLGPKQRARIDRLVTERETRKPVAQILGHKEFWSLPFLVSPDVLTPRPDSETLIEAALEITDARDGEIAIGDLGTGSGCLLLALLSELPNSRGVGIDLDYRACAIASQNAEALGLQNRAGFVVGDWANAIDGRFDIVLANPPYIAAAEFFNLDAEVRQFEPRRALYGGEDGLESYRRIAADLERLLDSGATALFEVGQGQAEGVRHLFAENPRISVRSRFDLGGIERCVLATVSDL